MSDPPPETVSPAPEASAEPASPGPPARRASGVIPAAIAVLAVAVAAVATLPYWAPGVMEMLPWGAAPAKPPTALGADPALAALKSQAAQNAAALQALSQQVAALAAKPIPDLAPLQQQVAALAAKPALDLAPLQQQVASLNGAVAGLAQKIAAFESAAQTAQGAPAGDAVLALVLLQIREAIDIGRPFEAEYRTLIALSRAQADIVAAATPLAGPAASGVASRVALVRRLHELAPQIATAAPPAKPGWRAQIVARLRALVTIRRVDGDGQSPAEAAVGTAERDLAGGDLDAAVAALSGLTGANLAAAQPWLQMARQRLQVEGALRQVEALIAAAFGGASAIPAKPPG